MKRCTPALCSKKPATDESPIAHLPALPPGFLAVPSPDPLGAALAHAQAEPGTVFWSDATGQCRLAIVLAPDRPIEPATLTALAQLACYDALASLAPPEVPMHLAGGAILVQGARAGCVEAHVGPGNPPGWAVLSATIATAALGPDPGRTPGETSLFEEGFGALDPSDLLVPICRNLLLWIDTWQDAGAEALAAALRARTAGAPRRAAA